MASKRGKRHGQGKVSNMCGICTNSETVHWYCRNCQENLCGKCKYDHKRRRKTRNDDIVPIQKANTHGEAISPMVCKIHPGKPCDLFCSQCDVIMCAVCLAQTHQHHAFKAIEEEMFLQKKYMQEELNTLRSHVSQYDTQPKQDSIPFEESVNSAIKDVESRRSELKANVDSMADSLITELSSLLKDFKESDDIFCRRHEKKIQEMKVLIRDIEEEVKEASRISSFFELTKRLKTTKSLFDTSTENVVSSPPRFVSGTINKSQLKSMLGYVQVGHDVARYDKRNIDSAHVKQISIFKVPQQNGIIWICPADSNHVWISVFGSKDLILVNKDGTVKESVKLEFLPRSLDLTTRGVLLMTRYGGSSLITSLSEDRRFTKFADISPLQAGCISVGNNDEVVVSTNSPTILILNKFGDEVRKLSCGGNGESIVCFSTGHVAVVVKRANSQYDLELKDQFDKTVYAWGGELGDGRRVSEMLLCQTCHDTYDRVFVPDYVNNQVYVVPGDSTKAICLLHQRHGITGPTAVGLDWCGHIRIGCQDGSVHVIEL